MMKFSSATLAKGIAALLAVAAIGAGTAYAGSAVSKNNLIDQGDAENFAIIDAGVDKKEITNIHSHLERDNGKYVYDVEFDVGEVEYEYEVFAEDGTILVRNIEENDNIVSTAKNTSDTDADKTGTSDQAAEQKTVASDSAQKEDTPAPTGGAENIAPTEDIKADSAEKNTETDSPAQIADAVPAEEDIKTDSADDENETPEAVTPAARTSEPAADKYIGVERAKQIALDDAGFTEEEVLFSTAKFDDDDEGPEYEIEFYHGEMEYEYDISAKTGEILEFSAEVDDD